MRSLDLSVSLESYLRSPSFCIQKTFLCTSNAFHCWCTVKTSLKMAKLKFVVQFIQVMLSCRVGDIHHFFMGFLL